MYFILALPQAVAERSAAKPDLVSNEIAAQGSV
jgi:hypothetical protein